MKKAMLEIIKTLQKNGYEAVLAGGCVRDMLLNIEPHDYDIATSATPDQVESLFKNTKSVGKSFGVIIVRKKGIDFEVATFRSDGNYSDGRRPDSITFTNMEEDAKRRDFTVNALFYDPINNKIFDFVNGKKDIENKILRFVGDPFKRIEEDNLRLLRFVRFLIKLNFNMDNNSFIAVKKYAIYINNVVSERIREEFIKMINFNNPRKVIELLFSTNLIYYMFPSIARLENEKQNPKWHPEGTALIHTLKALDHVKDENYIVKLAVLFHDVGKPDTHKIINGSITTRNHASVGAEIVANVLSKLRFSNDEIKQIKWLVLNHMKPVEYMRESKLKRFMAHPQIKDLIKVMKADKLGNLNNEPNKLASPNFLSKKLKEWKTDEIKPKPLINGKDLIDLGLKPGPSFKKILNKILDLQLERIVKTKEEALKFIKIDKKK